MSAAPANPSATVSGVRPDVDAGRRVAVLVLGMHRSGTSALTRMLSYLGCELPHNLLPDSDGNVLGHWESDPIRWFNEELLTTSGSYWNDWLPVNPDLSKSPVWPSLVERGRAVVAQEFADAPLFVLKDPRICRLMEFWLQVLTADEIEPAIVIPVRNPLEVARSLKARNGFDEGFTLLTWLRHVLEAEVSTRGLRRVVSDYEELLFGWEALAVKLERGLGISWPCMSPLSAQKIDDFIALDHRHHSVPSAALSTTSMVAPWVASAYAILTRWARSGVDSADYAALDAIRAAFDAAAPAFARPMLATINQSRHVAQLEAERDAARASLTTAEANVGDISAGLLGMTGERDGALATLETASLELDELRARLASVESALRQREEALSRAERADAEAAKRVGDARNATVRAEAETRMLRTDRDQARSSLDVAQGELADLREDVGRLRGRDAAATQAQAQARWLADVHAVLNAGPQWRGLLPRRWRRPGEFGRLKAAGLFDADAYLRNNPDVGAEGADPLHHYILFGMTEGRTWHGGPNA